MAIDAQLAALASTPDGDMVERFAIEIREHWTRGKDFLTDMPEWCGLSEWQRLRWLEEAREYLSLLMPILLAKAAQQEVLWWD